MAILSNDTYTARKRHICDSCLGSIEPGEKYERQRNVDDGEARTYKAHLRCIAASRVLWRNGIGGGDDTLLNVCDMDPEDRAAVYAADPEAFHACWPDRPAPGRPKLVSAI